MNDKIKIVKQIKFRVNELEYEKLQQSAKTLNISIPAFSKKRALEYRLRQPKVDKVGALEMAKELNMIGSNVNQIAKQSYSRNGSVERDIQHLQDTFNKVLEVFKELNK